MKLEISFREGWDNPGRFGPTANQLPDGTRRSIAPDLSGLIAIHGYNNTLLSARSLYDKLTAGLPGQDVTGLYWPGEHVAMLFMLAVENANESGWRLRDVLAGGPHDFITHSLGARVFCQAFNWGEGIEAGDVFLVAPAVNHDSLESPHGEFAGVPYHCKSLTLCVSGGDDVLADAYPKGAGLHKALGLHGPADIAKIGVGNVRVLDFTRLVHSHSGYFDLPEFYQAIQDCKAGKIPFGYTTI